MSAPTSARSIGSKVELTLRPKVPMYCLQGAAYVCALGAAEAVDARIRWPHTLLDEKGAPLATVMARGGYDDDGLFIRAAGEALTEEMATGIRNRAADWEAAITRREGKVAGPLAPVLEAYIDRLAGFCSEVEVVFPNGNVAAHGTFCGVDVWGRATVRTASGREVEVAPEQASLRPAD